MLQLGFGLSVDKSAARVAALRDRFLSGAKSFFSPGSKPAVTAIAGFFFPLDARKSGKQWDLSHSLAAKTANSTPRSPPL
ncbi:hypothetical protein [Phormidium sp. CCY1219]|uniref:hypothetical protein n=1 Tax=Phormidium sp. CCY1219 TaxID=2886104 RepID=UPI002D1F20F2|nr:hypothetical protein [Phormidium sp. CCY1219]MEB3827341.1 hypothetical protein [Phormidium sp. CCY1219]